LNCSGDNSGFVSSQNLVIGHQEVFLTVLTHELGKFSQVKLTGQVGSEPALQFDN
jgi:hypothetical protein